MCSVFEITGGEHAGTVGEGRAGIDLIWIKVLYLGHTSEILLYRNERTIFIDKKFIYMAAAETEVGSECVLQHAGVIEHIVFSLELYDRMMVISGEFEYGATVGQNISPVSVWSCW